MLMNATFTKKSELIPTKVYENKKDKLETSLFERLLLSEEKNGIKGYIGANSMSELTYAIILNLLHSKNIEIYILNIPSKEVFGYYEIKSWIDIGWIKLYQPN